MTASATSSPDREKIIAQARRVVIKLGTNVLVRDDGDIALSRVYSFIESIAELQQAGREILLVTSGAVGLGRQRLGLTQKPQLLPLKQACAAVGQGHLMALYSGAFDRFGINTAQVLLTESDFTDRQRYLNLRSTLAKLLELKVLPVINENDTISTAELEDVKPSYVKVSFGDNDKLSALVASKMEADLLILLTDVDGLYSDHPESENARLIPLVDGITPDPRAGARHSAERQRQTRARRLQDQAGGRRNRHAVRLPRGRRQRQAVRHYLAHLRRRTGRHAFSRASGVGRQAPLDRLRQQRARRADRQSGRFSRADRTKSQSIARRRAASARRIRSRRGGEHSRRKRARVRPRHG